MAQLKNNTTIGGNTFTVGTAAYVISNGNVGIGTSLPTTKFQVAGNINVSTSGSGIQFPDGSFQTTAATTTPPGGTNRAIQYNNNGVFGGDTTKLVLDTNGNVGIGTTSPQAPLHVQGRGTFGSNAAPISSGPYTLVSQDFQSGNLASSIETGSMYLSNNYNHTGVSAASIIDNYVNPNVVASSSGPISLLYGQLVVPLNYGSGAVTTLVGHYSIPVHAGSGNTTSLWGSNISPQVTGSGNVTASMIGITATLVLSGNGNVTGSGTGVNVGSPIASSNGKFTGTNYGIYIGNQNVSAITGTAYNFYSAGTTSKNIFDGNVGIGTNTVSSKLSVYGGNLQVGSTGYGVVFPDGTQQTTAATSTPPGGTTGAIQYRNSSGSFAGDSSNFYYDSVNHRVGIGTNATSSLTLNVVGNAPALFDTLNSADPQIIVGNSVSFGSTLGYNISSNYSYLSPSPSGTQMLIWTSNGVGLNGVIAPKNILDVSGGAVIGGGGAYAGSATAPANGLIVQGAVGIGLTNPAGGPGTLTVAGQANIYVATASTSTTTGAIVTTGGVGVAMGINAGGQVYAGSMNSAGTAIVNSLTSNTTVGATTGVQGGYLNGTTINASGTAIVNSLTSNGAISGTTIGGTVITASTGVQGGYLNGTTINASSAATVNALTSNGAISGTTIGGTVITASTGVQGGYLNGTTINASGAAIVNSLTSNTTITAGTGLTVSGGGASITGNSSFTGNVSIAGNLILQGNTYITQSNVLVVNNPMIYLGQNNPGNSWDIGLVGHYTTSSYYHTGLARNHNTGSWTLFDTLTSEPTNTINWADSTITYGTFTSGNVNVAASISSISTTSGALIVAGGAGIGGNLNVGGNIITSGTSGNISGVNNLFTVSIIASGNVNATDFNVAVVNSYVPVNGVFQPTANNLAFSTNSVQRTVIDSNGNVGIGTTSPFNTLHVSSSTPGSQVTVQGTAAAGYTNMLLQGTGRTYAIGVGNSSETTYGVANKFAIGDNNASAVRMVIDSNGNVGIGTTAPTSTLHVVGNANIYSTTASTSTTTGAIITAGGAGIAGNLTVGGNNNYFVGSVGIGISSPTSNLMVSGTNTGGTVKVQVQNLDNGVSSVSDVVSYHGSGSSTTLRTGYLYGAIIVNGANPLIFNNNSTERMRIDSSGNLGIGTTAPTSTLHVVGNANIYSTTASTSTTTGAIITAGGAGIAGNLNVGGTTNTFTGNVGIGTASTTYTLQVVGSFAASTKSFLIDHPTQAGKKLQYGSLESPYHGVRLTGQGTLIKGKCTVKLPEYIQGLVKSEAAQVQITNIRHGKMIWVDAIDIENHEFTVEAKVAKTDKKAYEFYWSFTAVRKDIEDLEVEF